MSAYRVAFLYAVVRLNAVSLVVLCALALLQPTEARAEGYVDGKVWVSRTLKCDGFDDNRCYRFADRRRRGKPYLEPRHHHHYTTYEHRRAHYDKYRYRYEKDGHDRYGRDRYGHGRYERIHHERDRDHDDRKHDSKYDERPYYGQFYERASYGRGRRGRYGRSDYYGRHDGRYERQCLYMVTTKGSEAQTENGALISAKRAWRAWVRSDHGERYQELDHAKNGEYRCWRSSTNESALGRAGEFLTGQYRKRCQVWAVPCLGERQKLEGDKDDRE